ncbi:hypothetical protein GCM10011512_01740 [Tersicoccus solisilvae]|uniref:Uncharacterized protein n=1 Tax=Tersicoccus solisilvae TaxID=1882339 RepID=A0ABQ1NJG3_9MICC|nr:hypothetical protein GCM10011512_01740 [Tersicoccus solisilvae]
MSNTPWRHGRDVVATRVTTDEWAVMGEAFHIRPNAPKAAGPAATAGDAGPGLLPGASPT